MRLTIFIDAVLIGTSAGLMARGQVAEGGGMLIGWLFATVSHALR